MNTALVGVVLLVVIAVSIVGIWKTSEPRNDQ